MSLGRSNALIQDAFLAEGRRTPEAPALVSSYGRCSFAELAQISGALSVLLSARGVGRGSVVAIFSDRNPALVYCMLGVLRSGAAFHIVDAAYPLPRILACLRQTRPAFVLNAGAVVEPAPLRTALGPDLAERWATVPASAVQALTALGDSASDARPLPGDPADAAYVNFTSGSTGTPKGIVATHAWIPHFAAWQAAHGGLSAADRFTMLSGLSHTPLLRDVFTPLSIGASLHIPEQATIFDAEALWRWFASEQITVANLTPAVGEILASGAPEGARLEHLRRLYWGGDVLRPSLAAQLGRAAPRLVQTNLYGTTETAGMAYFDLAEHAGDGPIPIGRGIPGAQLLLVDEHGQLCAPGEIGEIWIRSPYHARGYLDDPAQTRARFVRNPFTGALDDLCYRTGDRGRDLDDGTVVFAGRADHQVKIRGFRVEPAEIAAAIERLPGVHRALVRARELRGEPQLVAYLVCQGGAQPVPAELRAALRRELPSYMIPRWWTVLADFPLLPNGKIDLQALPLPRDDELGARSHDESRRPPATEAERPLAALDGEPATPTEQRLAAIWCEVLGVAEVGRHDSFFELGGHSLLAVRTLSRIRAAFSVELALRGVFETSTIEGLARELDRAMDGGLAGGGASTFVPVVPVPPEDRGAALPLPFAQQRLWFLHRLDPDSRAYNQASAHRLRGPLDVEALRRAFEALIDRHEALRTVFPASDGVPRQEVLPAGRFTLPVDDLSQLAPIDREHEAARRAEAAALERFDLTTGPVLRARVLRLSEADHILLLEVHHIVADGWSQAVLRRELAALYGAFLHGQPPHLPPLPIQYADYAIWSRRWLTGEVLEGQLAYWKQLLADAPVDLPLPYRAPGCPGAAGMTGTAFRGGRIDLALDADLTRRLRALAHHHGATLFMVLLAALRALLARTTGQRDLCIGTAIANRDRTEIEGLIGMFANTLVLRGPVHAGDRFVDLLARERDLALAAYAHAHAPFEMVVDALGLAREPDRMPLIQVVCVDQGNVTDELALPGLAPGGIEKFRIDLKITPFDLIFDTRERAGIREFTVSYRTALFDRDTIVALVDRYHRLLRGIADQPELPVSQLALLAPAERAALFDEPARRVSWEPRGPTVMAQIERWMAEAPGAPAILWHDTEIPYHEVDARSAALAALLRRRGVGPDRTVAMVGERSPLQIIGLVATLRAGGAYVPIGPDLPADRIGWMLDETAPVAILCDGPPPAALGRHAAAVIRLDEPWPAPPELSALGDPVPAVSPDALAYVIYTSGSTGRPKGVMISRRSFDAQVHWIQDAFPLDARDRLLQLSSAMFDFSIEEMLWPLTVGGAVVLPRHRGELEPAYLAELATRHAATVVHFVPSLLRVVVDACQATPWTTIEQLICGGEALPLDLARACQAVFPHAAVQNPYGPTETTIIATCDRYHPGDEAVLIGGPVADTTAYVLDDELAPVPPGGVGQLWIGGIQLARGYLARPGLTADRFRPSPFAARPGERIYQTGDLVRQRADGALEYLGRADFQVKVRGFRIELGEIEAALQDHPQVRAALVVALDDRSAGKRLVAYVCLAESAVPIDVSGNLRDFVAARLPAYMIPSAFVVLGELPRTANGKIDRKALPAPKDDAYQRAAYVAPATPTEQRVAAIWGETLGSAGSGGARGPGPLGRHDDFFAVGGHSLLAVRVISRLRAALGVELPLRTLFEAPTVERLAREVDRRLAEGGARAPVPLVPLSPEDRAGVLALSSAQQRLWFLHQLDPDGRAYHVSSAHRLRGPLDVEALRHAFEALIDRHEALRTVFPATDGVPRQEVLPASRFSLPVEDLSAPAPTTEEGRDREAVRRAEAAKLERFDLARGPLVRARVLRLSVEDHILLVDLHHIVADGWSLNVLWRELAALYSGFVRGQPPALPPLPVQYVDYAAWLGRWLTGEVLEGQLAYWTRQLADAPVDLPLPYRGPASAGATYRGARIDAVLDAELTRRLHALAYQHGATLFMVLSAVLRVLLVRITGQRDLCIGTAVANRDQAELEGLIGMFVNTLVLRGPVHPRERFVDVLGRERDLALAAYARAHAPFERVVDALGLPRDPDRMPLIQVMCVDQGEVAGEAVLPGLTAEPFRTELASADFDLAFNTRERAGVRELTVTYKVDRFEREAVAALVERYQRLLVEIADRPDLPLAELARTALLSPTERAALFEEPARRVTWAPRGPGVMARIERWMAETPDAPALIFDTGDTGDAGDTGRVDYRELDTRSAALAARLRRRGVGPDRTVAVVAERGAPQIIAMVAVLRAGGAYVPIKPDLPGERIGWMLDEAAPAVILCDGLPPPALARHAVVRIDEPWPEAPEAHDAPDVRDEPDPRDATVPPDALAYIIYTSGSTGRPKGVMITRRGFDAQLRWMQDEYPLAAQGRVLQLAPAMFDFSVVEIFWPLMAGGAVILPRHRGEMDPAYLGRIADEHAATVVNFVPSLLRAVIDACQRTPGTTTWATPWATIQQVFCGGEALAPDLVRDYRAVFPRAALHNQYGPTETTINATSWRCRPDDTSVPIGHPVADTTVYVLDDELAPVPPGGVGQLWIGGVQLARGYLARPALTAERFRPSPFAARPGERIYQTGDLVRQRPDGVLEYLGRADFQVKVRGFRIELGEIEAALSDHPQVRAAVVVARDDGAQGKHLVAYVCLSGSASPAELRDFISARLPAYMIPSAFVVLGELPRTSTGKIDRKALPAPLDDAYQRAAYVAPGTPTERLLAATWCEVLGKDRVGIHDNFFALGGHSLLAVRAISRLGAAFSVELPLRCLFDAPTVESLAHEVDRRRAEDGATTAVPLVPVPRDGALALSSTQHRLWFLHQLDPDSRAYNMPSAHRLRGPLDLEALRRAFEALIGRHEALRTVFPACDGIPRQDVLPASSFALPVDDLAALAPVDRERCAARRAEQAAMGRFDLARGPLLRARVLRLSDVDHILLLDLHHIVSDGWSTTVLWRELAALYAAGIRGEVADLAPLPVQYVDYAAWLRRWLTGEVLDRQLAYWTQHLADAPVELPLPYRGPRPRVATGATFRGGRIELTLDAELTRRLHALAHHHGATLFMVLLAALRTLLARYTGQHDLCIGTVVANRDRRELEGLIGMFVNTLVLRGPVRGGDRFVDVLARERDLTLSAYAHAHAPFEQVVDALGLERRLDRMPLIQVMCADQGDATGNAVLPGLVTEPFRIDLEIEKFDLTLGTCERAGVREITVSYNADLFDRATVAALAARYERLLRGIADRPELPVSQLALLGSAERAALFDDPARRVTWQPRAPTVMAQIERWMAETPDAPALLWDAGRIDYRELEARSAVLAALLRRRGVRPDHTVAVVAERSALQIIGLVAVLRAGGAYVPIRPDLPAERIGWILDETAPVVILCDGAPPPALDRRAGAVVRLDAPWPAGPDLPALDDPPAPVTPPDALAYIIYTSGSTGRPKGVMVTRRGFDAQLRWTLDAFPIDPSVRCLQLASAMFDFSVIEIFWTLMAGGALVLPRPGGELDPAYLAALTARHAVTAVHFVPSLLRAVVDACQGAPWSTVEQVFCGGEALAPDLVRDCRAVFPRAALYNQYGPTEATVSATYWRCHPDDTSVPIGHPIADTTVYVLDDELAPVPPGGIGQLWIGGVQLARGYLARPGLTADRFRPSPFAARPGERIYQTGDLVRQRADGALEYLGRADFQVKVRGFRIELGEIEATLHDHPQVRAGLVVARDDGTQGKLLVAYVCLSGPATPAELSAFLATRLPGYMIPSAFVVLDELPRTATGKIDHKALPAPAEDAFERGAYEAPATPTEQRLAAIWREVLGVEQVGRYDSFFALGGHSLLVIRFVSQIRRRFGVELPPRAVFEGPTLADQAERILARARGAEVSADDPAERALVEHVAALPDAEVFAQLAEWSSLMLDIPPASAASGLAGPGRALAERLIAQHRIDVRPSQPLARRTSPTAPATFAQQLQWDYHQRGNFPTLGIHATAFAVRGPLDAKALQQAIADLALRQASLRTVFSLSDGRLIQTVQDVGPALDVVDLSGMPMAERPAEARRRFEAISRPHDLTGEVFRAQLVRLDPDDHLLYLAPHHIAVDGFSWGVLEAELAALYRARAAGAADAAALAPLALSCRDFCFWQTSLEDRPVGRAQLAFWARAVAGYPGLELPGDRRAVPRGSVGLATDTYEAASVPFVLDGPRWTATLRLCAHLGTTPYVAITSGFLLLLARWSGRNDVCALSSNFHRNRPGSEAVIGNFVTPYPLRVAFDERAHLEAAVHHCHDRVLLHREHAHVAPSSALAAWPEWSRYNVNYQIEGPGDGTPDYGAARVERLGWSVLARRTPHDLALFVRQDARGVGGSLVYNAERFSPELAARAAARLGQLIDLLATDPAHRVGALPRAP